MILTFASVISICFGPLKYSQFNNLNSLSTFNSTDLFNSSFSDLFNATNITHLVSKTNVSLNYKRLTLPTKMTNTIPSTISARTTTSATNA